MGVVETATPFTPAQVGFSFVRNLTLGSDPTSKRLCYAARLIGKPRTLSHWEAWQKHRTPAIWKVRLHPGEKKRENGISGKGKRPQPRGSSHSAAAQGLYRTGTKKVRNKAGVWGGKKMGAKANMFVGGSPHTQKVESSKSIFTAGEICGNLRRLRAIWTVSGELDNFFLCESALTHETPIDTRTI